MKISPLLFFKMALISLQRHPVRSGLALLGIVIGIASMTLTMAIGEGANARLTKEILAMGDRWIYIMPGNFLTKGEVKKAQRKEKNLQYDDYLAIKQLSSDIQACTPCIEKKEVVKFKGDQIVADVQGVSSDFFRIEPRGIKTGVPFSLHHDERGSAVAILGSEVARELFHKENPVGKRVMIGKTSFQVLGVFNEAPKKMNRMQNPNLNIVVPFSSVWRKVIPPIENGSLHHIIARPKEGKNSAKVVSGLRRLLRFRHHISENHSDDFTIWDMQAVMEAAHRSSQTFNQFLILAASISLLVGGIGIMNIMLVAMTERRREIGIKMAIGASQSSILFQFLIESILLCLTGGVIGVLCGISGAYVLGKLTDFEWLIREKPIFLAFATTVFVGLFFGFYPAYQASKLNPVDALKST